MDFSGNNFISSIENYCEIYYCFLGRLNFPLYINVQLKFQSKQYSPDNPIQINCKKWIRLGKKKNQYLNLSNTLLKKKKKKVNGKKAHINFTKSLKCLKIKLKYYKFYHRKFKIGLTG